MAVFDQRFYRWSAVITSLSCTVSEIYDFYDVAYVSICQILSFCMDPARPTTATDAASCNVSHKFDPQDRTTSTLLCC